MYANTSLDIPAISFDMERMAYERGYLIVDVGGDDAGAIGLGRYAEGFSAYAPDQLDLWYVVNRYRYLTEEPGETLKLMYEIEAVSRMRHTGIVNNSNLGKETTADTVCRQCRMRKRSQRRQSCPWSTPPIGGIWTFQSQTDCRWMCLSSRCGRSELRSSGEHRSPLQIYISNRF